MRPIPKYLLIHTVVMTSDGTEDNWGKKSGTTDTTIKHVRMEPTSKRVVSKDNRQIQLLASLIYDNMNSVPRDLSFSAGDKITWGSKSYVIETAEPLYDHGKIHHWELGLS